MTKEEAAREIKATEERLSELRRKMEEPEKQEFKGWRVYEEGRALTPGYIYLYLHDWADGDVSLRVRYNNGQGDMVSGMCRFDSNGLRVFTMKSLNETMDNAIFDERDALRLRRDES